jgi:light-regulated signal transduction histidine kinase (bacteriophytochrome)
LSEFLLRACHDLRGPLRSVRTYSEILQRDAAEQSSDPNPALGFIVAGSARAGLLIDGLAEYCLALQIDTGTFQPVPTDVILRAALAKLAQPLRENNAEVVYEGLPRVCGNADRLMQLFEHLIDNALRNRGTEDPRIRVSAEHDSAGWLFRVADNGPGIEAEYLERIFKPFERVHGKERHGPGLAICRVIVERHGGTLWAESPPGDGFAFCFTIPEEM